MRPALLSIALLAIPLSAIAGAPLVIDAATQARLQIVTAPIGVAHAGRGVDGFASVIDPSVLIGQINDFKAARATAAASHAEAQRTQALKGDATVSARTAESAQAQAATDQARLDLLRAQMTLQIGPGLARVSADRLSHLADDLAAGRAALVRVDTPSGQGLASARTVLLHVPAFGDVNAAVLGPARSADARLQSPGVIVLVQGEAARWLSSGLNLSAQLQGAVVDGLLIPNAALLRQNGHVLAYVKTANGLFEQRVVQPVRVLPEGLMVKSGFRAGERIVVQGASALYTASAAPADGDD